MDVDVGTNFNNINHDWSEYERVRMRMLLSWSTRVGSLDGEETMKKIRLWEMVHQIEDARRGRVG